MRNIEMQTLHIINSNLPKITKALERIAEVLEDANKPMDVSVRVTPMNEGDNVTIEKEIGNWNKNRKWEVM